MRASSLTGDIVKPFRLLTAALLLPLQNSPVAAEGTGVRKTALPALHCQARWDDRHKTAKTIVYKVPDGFQGCRINYRKRGFSGFFAAYSFTPLDDRRQPIPRGSERPIRYFQATWNCGGNGNPFNRKGGQVHLVNVSMISIRESDAFSQRGRNECSSSTRQEVIGRQLPRPSPPGQPYCNLNGEWRPCNGLYNR